MIAAIVYLMTALIRAMVDITIAIIRGFFSLFRRERELLRSRKIQTPPAPLDATSGDLLV